MSRGALAGVRVLDLSRFVSGPLCTFFLASLGAEVIAIEPPNVSTSRRLPPFAHPEGGAADTHVEGALAMPFLKRGRGKRSIAVDITRPEGADLARAISARCDVVVENSKPGTMARLGLGFDSLARGNPRLVYIAISGYGPRGGDRPAMDNIVQAACGLMARTGFPDGPPLRAGTTVADHTTATFAALGALAALRHRDATGRGQLVDVSMLDVMTALVWDEPVDHYEAAGLPVRTGNADARGTLIDTYRCADGWVSVTCTSDRQWDALAAHVGVPGAPRSQAGRVVAQWAATRPARVVEAELLACGMPAGRVRHPVEARDDPNVRVLEELRHPLAPRGSGFLGPRLPLVLDGRVEVAPAELHGASTDAVLRELVGLREDDLARLRADGVIA